MWKPIDRRNDDVKAQPTPDLSEQTRSLIRDVCNCYPTRRAALLPALHLAQEQIGYLPAKTLGQVAELLGLSPTEVLDTASFYEMFWLSPKGHKLVAVCESFACELCGQVDLLGALEGKLRIKPGETTPDGRFTLITVQCLAACDRAPVVMVNDVLFERVSVEKLDEVLAADTPPISHDTLVRAIELHKGKTE
jgi:NADH-quinone oxidoreductase E subunit